MTYFKKGESNWFCYPCKVGALLCFVYFNSKYMSSALSMANLFELATKEESAQKPDLVVILVTMMEMTIQTSIMIKPMIFG